MVKGVGLNTKFCFWIFFYLKEEINLKEKLTELNKRDRRRLFFLKRKKRNLEREILNLEIKIQNREFQLKKLI